MNFVVVLLLVFVVVVKFAFFLDFWNLQASKKITVSVGLEHFLSFSKIPGKIEIFNI